MNIIDIDITSVCNLTCFECSRGCSTSMKQEHIDLQRIVFFVEESIAMKKFWERIYVTGGEATLNPEIETIVQMLKIVGNVTVKTNGTTKQYERLKDTLDVEWMNSDKDDGVDHISFFQSCDPSGFEPSKCPVFRSCGIGLTGDGYVPCNASSFINKTFDIGAESDTLRELNDDKLLELCSHCGFCNVGTEKSDELWNERLGDKYGN